MIKVTPFPSHTSYYTGKSICDVCGKKINLDLPFSRGMEVSHETYDKWGGKGNAAYPVRNVLYAHAGACETMAVLQVSNAISSPTSK